MKFKNNLQKLEMIQLLFVKYFHTKRFIRENNATKTILGRQLNQVKLERRNTTADQNPVKNDVR